MKNQSGRSENRSLVGEKETGHGLEFSQHIGEDRRLTLASSELRRSGNSAATVLEQCLHRFPTVQVGGDITNLAGGHAFARRNCSHVQNAVSIALAGTRCRRASRLSPRASDV